MSVQPEFTHAALRHLFDAELEYQDDMKPIVSAEGRDGVLIGSGDGRVAEAQIDGTIRWSMYAGDCAYLLVRAGVEPPSGQHLCTVSPGGVIETNDGAQIWFDARGYGLRGADPEQPHLWRLTMSVQFNTSDQRYTWLNETPAVWVGLFDEKAGRAHYRTYTHIFD